jgi:hypothetical protein
MWGMNWIAYTQQIKTVKMFFGSTRIWTLSLVLARHVVCYLSRPASPSMLLGYFPDRVSLFVWGQPQAVILLPTSLMQLELQLCTTMPSLITEMGVFLTCPASFELGLQWHQKQQSLWFTGSIQESKTSCMERKYQFSNNQNENHSSNVCLL